MPISGAVLDHVAVAVERWAEAWPRYVSGLGGNWASGGFNVGFAPAQLAFANGARLEVLQPWQTEANDFLRRFLDSSGPGPHHLTFKVPDIEAALQAVQAAGLTPVSVDLSEDDWKEAFLHPRQATGTVVQLAQAAGTWESVPPEGFPKSSAAPADLAHVTHVVADWDSAVALFVGLLGGTIQSEQRASPSGWRTATVSWAGPLRLRLVAAGSNGPADSSLRSWLGGRNGRVHHLAFRRTGAPGEEKAETGPVPGVLVGEHVVEQIPPENNHGTRLVVLGGAAPAASRASDGAR